MFYNRFKNGAAPILTQPLFFCAIVVTGLFEGLCKALNSNPGTGSRTADTHFVPCFDALFRWKCVPLQQFLRYMAGHIRPPKA